MSNWNLIENGAVAPVFPAGALHGESSVTRLLARVREGDREAFDRLIPLVYGELHRIAESYLRRERPGRTLQPTALIHEAYLRLAHYGHADYENRSHFLGVAARVMRQILVDSARARNAGKRDAGLKVELRADLDFAPENDRVVLALDDALKALAGVDERKARLIEMRFFAGMSAEEIGACVGAPAWQIRRELRAAQAWLRRQMTPRGEMTPPQEMAQ
jgi:RNA polymerase sigma factor (TIGR02999 family)